MALWTGLVLAGCSSSQPTASDQQDYPCDVKAVIQNRCLPCHSPDPQYPVQVPFTFEKYSNTRGTTDLVGPKDEPIWQAMGDLIADGGMPLERRPPYSTPDPLSPADSATMLSWVDAGAPPRAQGTTCP